ncbi:MAG: metalloregulator ArsR/SmtB family transcription factor [Kofleriaceae bacterium]
MTLEATFEALSDATRRGVIDLLRRKPRRAGELAEELGQSRPAMSRHLRVLHETGLIEPTSDDADARAKIFRLRPEPFTALRGWLDDVELYWSNQLSAFAAHAEKRKRTLTGGERGRPAEPSARGRK